MPEKEYNIETAQSPDPYFCIEYDSKGRFCTYWHQINEILKLAPSNVLEVGIGNGFTRQYLHKMRIDVISLDIAYELSPNVVGSVLSLPFTSESFDVVACYEVLEHLFYENFSTALRELARASRRHLILSIPDTTSAFRFFVEFPSIKSFRKLIPSPFPRPKLHEFDGYHYWEIGKKGYPLSKIKHDMINSGLIISKTFRVFEYSHHRFFVLEKQN